MTNPMTSDPRELAERLIADKDRLTFDLAEARAALHAAADREARLRHELFWLMNNVDGALLRAFIAREDGEEEPEWADDLEVAANRARAALADSPRPASEPRLPSLDDLIEVIHDATPVEEDGGLPDVCNRWSDHERVARAVAARLAASEPPQPVALPSLAAENDIAKDLHRLAGGDGHLTADGQNFCRPVYGLGWTAHLSQARQRLAAAQPVSDPEREEARNG